MSTGWGISGVDAEGLFPRGCQQYTVSCGIEDLLICLLYPYLQTGTGSKPGLAVILTLQLKAHPAIPIPAKAPGVSPRGNPPRPMG